MQTKAPLFHPANPLVLLYNEQWRHCGPTGQHAELLHRAHARHLPRPKGREVVMLCRAALMSLMTAPTSQWQGSAATCARIFCNTAQSAVRP